MTLLKKKQSEVNEIRLVQNADDYSIFVLKRLDSIRTSAVAVFTTEAKTLKSADAVFDLLCAEYNIV